MDKIMKETSQKSYGKYGKAREEYLQKVHPEQYRVLVESGSLEKHLVEREKVVQRWVNDIFEDSLKRSPFPSEGELSAIIP